ncbi:MAG: ATPase domain-containing protein [Halorhodospira sp.]
MGTEKERLSSGISGLDEILDGGFLAHHQYHIRGGPGCGKTTLGLHFLAAEPEATTLHVTFGEQPEQLREDFEAFSEVLRNTEILDLSPDPSEMVDKPTYDIFASSEVDSQPIIERIRETAERLRPDRVFIDSLTQLRYLTPEPAQFRSQVLGLLRAFTTRGATVLFTSEASAEAPDDDLRFLSDGVLTVTLHEDGARSVEVSKVRGSGFRTGAHDVYLSDQGMDVKPQLVPSSFNRAFETQVINAGVPGIDELAGGGVHRGTTTLIAGPSGSGKTTFGLQFMKEAAGRGEGSAVFLFEEDPQTLLHRADALSMPMRDMVDQGMLYLERVEPLHYTPTQLAHAIRHLVETRDVRIVMIDSIAGYRLALGSEDPLREFYSLTQYLKNMGVTTFLVNEIDATAASQMQASRFDISPLVDNIYLLNLVIDAQYRLHKQVRMIKRRTGSFSNQAGWMEFTPYGIQVQSIGPGEMQGVATAYGGAQHG